MDYQKEFSLLGVEAFYNVVSLILGGSHLRVTICSKTFAPTTNVSRNVPNSF